LVRESMDVHEHLENDLMPLFHGGNRGSNPLGDAKYIRHLIDAWATSVPLVSRLWFRDGRSRELSVVRFFETAGWVN